MKLSRQPDNVSAESPFITPGLDRWLKEVVSQGWQAVGGDLAALQSRASPHRGGETNAGWGFNYQDTDTQKTPSTLYVQPCTENKYIVELLGHFQHGVK